MAHCTYIAVSEFLATAWQSPFGQNLRSRCLALMASAPTHSALMALPYFADQIFWINPEHVNYREDTRSEYQLACGDVDRISRAQMATWGEMIWGRFSIIEIAAADHDALPREAYHMMAEEMWLKFDMFLWVVAKALDKPDAPGAIAKRLGLFDPDSLDRLKFSKYLFPSLDPTRGTIQLEPATTPAPPRSEPCVEPIPIVTPAETVAKSGHAYVAEHKESAPKTKVKTRKATDGEETAPVPEDDLPADRIDSLPDFLPEHWKLGKKVMKVCYVLVRESRYELIPPIL